MVCETALGARALRFMTRNVIATRTADESPLQSSVAGMGIHLHRA